MADYWISQQRHYCKYCNTWIANNKIQMQQHENGLRHKHNVENYLKRSHRENETKKKESKQIEKELRRIDAAARLSMYGGGKTGSGTPNTAEAPTCSSNQLGTLSSNVGGKCFTLPQQKVALNGIQILGQSDEYGGYYDSNGGYYDRNGHYFIYDYQSQLWHYVGWYGNNTNVDTQKSNK
ncbi:WW domain-binding protein 4 [Galdieria sulphuraria]|nr:WW domain-binding protein 4 [Galdieria sulphuraria]